MASLVDYFPLPFFLFIFISLLQTQARENLFFSKAVRYETPKELTDLPKGEYEELEKLYPQSQNGYGLHDRYANQFLPSTYTNAYSYNKKQANVLPPRFTNNEFRTQIYDKKDNVARYKSHSDGFSGREFGDVKYRYDANVDGYLDGYNRDTSYKYSNGRVGYQKNQNLEKQEYIP